jgi:hypothetical protein
MAEALLERGNPNRLGKGNTGFRATNTRVRLGALAAFALAALAMASPSWAVVTFTFDFNSLANGASSTAIRNYMRTVSGDNALTVTGAIASRTYNGDGHVVGPTLGPDTFIINNGPGSNQFLINFGGFFFISSISFDWEIFPDASCQAHSACAGHGQSDPNWPDFDLYVNGGAVPVFHRLAPVPASANTSPQAIGNSGVIDLVDGHSLLFVDWPAEIGIDNLVITGCFSTSERQSCLKRDAPEPSSLLLALLALAMLGYAGARVGQRQR